MTGNGTGQIDFKAIAATALSRARNLLPQWLPAGRIQGREFVCGNINGDSGRSFSVNLDTGKFADFAGDVSGRDLVDLYAVIHGIDNLGVAALRLAEELGIAQPKPTAKSKPEGVTLQALAEAKDLPIEHLVRCGWQQAGKIVKVAYCNRDGTPALRFRYRVKLTGKDHYRWNKPPGDLGPYGRNTLAPGPDKALHIVEGETDAVTLWLHAREALGIPGATMTACLQKDDLAGFDQVVIHHEPDEGGDIFVPRLLNRLVELNYEGRVKVISLPADVKDVNGLHCRWRDDSAVFEAELNKLIKAAEPIALAGRPRELPEDNPAALAKVALTARHTADGTAILFFADGGFWEWK